MSLFADFSASNSSAHACRILRKSAPLVYRRDADSKCRVMLLLSFGENGELLISEIKLYDRLFGCAAWIFFANINKSVAVWHEKARC